MTRHPRPESDLMQRRHEATARHTLSVNTLLDQREELRGVVGLADLVRDAARWAA